jgi:DNA-binding MarR family transcriptional regulator
MVDVANHLGISKQAASQLVELLVQRGYVERTQHPTDARSSVLSLTPRGWACTKAAEASAAKTIMGWERTVGRSNMDSLTSTLSAVVAPGPIRPAW